MTRSYAYTSLENAGETLTWKCDGHELTAKFEAKTKNKIKTIRASILEVLKKSNTAMFSDEIWKEVRRVLGQKVLASSVKNKLTSLYRLGKISRLDRSKGWKFARGFLYGLNQAQIKKRLEITSGELSVYTDVEMGIAKNVESAVKRTSDIRDELGFDQSLITWLSRKLGKESEYFIKSIGKGESYRVQMVKGQKERLGGKGLIPWLRYIRIVGDLIFYDDRLPFDEIKKRVTRIAYWITEEGERRRRIGDNWADFCNNLFSLLDRKHDWELHVLEHKEKWRGMSGREFDHVYECRLGAKEFGIRIYIVIECKAGILKSQMVDEFWRKIINESLFRNYEDGGIKANVVPILMIGKTVEKNTQVLEKCRRRGIRVVFHTPMQDAFLRLTGQKISLQKLLEMPKEAQISVLKSGDRNSGKNQNREVAG